MSGNPKRCGETSGAAGYVMVAVIISLLLMMLGALLLPPLALLGRIL